MSESISLRFLYNTVPGRVVLKVLTHPVVSIVGGALLSTSLSAKAVQAYIKNNNIDMSRYEVPSKGFRSFNDFFTRKLKPEFLNYSDEAFASPCDGLLTATKIDRRSVFRIKNCDYSLGRLLRNKELAREFKGGTAFIFRLTPNHYHRYRFCANGIVSSRHRINGVLHCVRPIALEKLPVFIENSREYVVIGSKSMGDIVQMEVGALMVGKIANNKKNRPGSMARVNAEKGYFEFGGSTIIVLTKERRELDSTLLSREKNDEGEIPVGVGEKLFAD